MLTRRSLLKRAAGLVAVAAVVPAIKTEAAPELPAPEQSATPDKLLARREGRPVWPDIHVDQCLDPVFRVVEVETEYGRILTIA